MEKRTRFIFALAALAAGSACCEAPVAAVSPGSVRRGVRAAGREAPYPERRTHAENPTERFAFEKY